MNEKLDQVIDLLYDEHLLHWKSVRSIDLVVQGILSKYKHDFSEAEGDFLLHLLIEDGYIKSTKDGKDYNNFSLTTKGIQLRQNGGFVKQAKVEQSKNKLYTWSLYAIVVAGVYYLVELINSSIALFNLCN